MSVKILVALNEAFQALQGHLEGMPSSVRSERMRALASIGLQIQTGKLQAAVCSPDYFIGGGARKTGFLKFPVVLNEAYPDLHLVLRDTPARLRAERLRSLASLGLHAVSVSPGVAPVRPVQPPQPPLEPTRSTEVKKTPRAMPGEVQRESAREPQINIDKTPLPEPAVESGSIPPLNNSDLPSKRLNSRVARLARSLGA